jgi:histidinol-phosphate phosphatase family protein
MTRQAIILAGGKGTRLRARLDGRPKPLVDIDGVPLLGRQIAALRAGGFSEILVLVNHAADQIESYCASPAFGGLSLTLVDDGEPRGTAGALLHAYDQLSSRFLVVYGDTLFDIDLDRFWRAHEAAHADASLFVHPNDHPGDSDLTETDEDGRVTAFYSPPHQAGRDLPNLVNAGLYVMEREAVAFWRERPPPTDIARDLFQAMLRRGARLQGYLSFEYIKDIGTPARLDRAVAHLRAGVVDRARRDRPQKAVFLDCEGTITECREHFAPADQLALIDGAADAVKQLNEAEYRVAIAADQPGAARGETDLAEMHRIHRKLQSLLGQQGAFVDAIYLCPHHPDPHQPDKVFAGEVPALKIPCEGRKAGIGLVEHARRDLNIDIGRSWFVGDSTSDILTARNAGLRSILVETGKAGRDGEYGVMPDFIMRDLPAAARFITRVQEPLAEISRQIAQHLVAGSLVLVGGLARQGKSTLTAVLRYELVGAGQDARILALDGFLRNQNDRDPGVLGRYDLDSVHATLTPWLRREGTIDIDVPIYDRLTRRRAPRGTALHLTPDSVLIVDGVPALLMEPITRRRIVRVFVDGDEAVRQRRVVDDLIARGMSPEQAQSTTAERAEDETPIVMASAADADIVLSLDAILAGLGA